MVELDIKAAVFDPELFVFLNKPRIEVIHELPEHELTYVCGCRCRKHAIGEDVSEQLEIVPMQIRVIKHCGCRDCETAPSQQTSQLN